MLLIEGGGITVNETPLLAWPLTVITTLPLLATLATCATNSRRWRQATNVGRQQNRERHSVAVHPAGVDYDITRCGTGRDRSSNGCCTPSCGSRQRPIKANRAGGLRTAEVYSANCYGSTDWTGAGRQTSDTRGRDNCE